LKWKNLCLSVGEMKIELFNRRKYFLLPVFPQSGTGCILKNFSMYNYIRFLSYTILSKHINNHIIGQNQFKCNPAKPGSIGD